MAHRPSDIPPFVPGISHIPDKLDSVNPGERLWRIESEFVDFLTTILDLLDIMHLIKNKNLRATTSMPHEVLRELNKFKKRGRLSKEFERALEANPLPASPSVEALVGEHDIRSSRYTRATLAVPKVKSQVDPDLVVIFGKRLKPKWHMVLVEEPDKLATPSMVMNENLKKMSRAESLKQRLVDPRRRVGSAFSIKFATSAKKLEPTAAFMGQLARMEASAAGFTSVAQHQLHLKTLTPHWFTDLVRDAVHVGVVNSTNVSDAFIALGTHYDMTCSSLQFAKAKLCYVLMSLPIWDVARTTTQRAAEFILKKILLIPKGDKIVVDWLKSRGLPFVALPPISDNAPPSTLDANSQQADEPAAAGKPSDTAAPAMGHE